MTLIELLVVLVIAAALVGVVSVSGASRPERELRTEAERLALTLSLARELSQVRGRPIRWLPETQGYRFEMWQAEAWRPVDDDPDLRPRSWGTETRVVLERAEGLQAIEFGRDQVDPPFTLRVQRAGMTFLIHANGLGDFEVRE